MAVVNLGTETLIIGQNPVQFLPFPYDATQAYLIAGVFGVGDFSSIFSRARIRALLEPAPGLQFYHPDVQTLDILDGIVTFWLPMSPLFLGSGTVTLEAERLANRYGGADNQTAVTLNLLYEDTISVPTWRG